MARTVSILSVFAFILEILLCSYVVLSLCFISFLNKIAQIAHLI